MPTAEITHYVTYETKYLGPTNYKGARVSAWRSGDDRRAGERIIVAWNCELDSTANHTAAARALADKLGYFLLPQGGRAKHGYIYLVQAYDTRPLPKL